MRTVGRTLQVALLSLPLLCSLGSRTFHSLGPLGGGGSGGERSPLITQTVGAAPTTTTRRASFVAAGLGSGSGGRFRGSEGGGGMHSPGMLGARLGAFLRTPAFRALPRRSGGVVRLQGVGLKSRCSQKNRSTKRNSSTVAAKEVVEEGHAASGSATGATRRGRGAGAGKAKLGRRGASETAAGAKFDLARGGYEYAEILTYLSSPPEHALKGVGPKRAQQLTKLGIVDRRQVSRVTDLAEGEIATVLLKVVAVNSRISGPTRISCVDVDEQQLDIILFGGPAWRRGAEFRVGETKVVSGKVSKDKYTGALVMASPDVVAPLADLKKVMVVQPIYPLTSGLSLSQIRGAVNVALDTLEGMRLPPEWVDEDLMRERGWPGLREALLAAHNPQDEADLSLTAVPRSRLAYDELLASQLVLAMRRRQLRGAARPPTLTAHAGEAGATGNEGTESGAGHSYSSSEASVATSAKTEGKEKGKGLVEEGVERLPFELTRNQSKSLDEILGDMDGVDGRGLRMFRLLQGDVGSGKTAVAFLAMLKAAEQGTQSCILAPTEVLTAQHLRTLRSMAEGIRRPDGSGDLRVELLTGSLKGKARQKLLEDVGNGEVDILVATHAVLASASTAFRDLGLAVVDEEQRFGVEQRDRLTAFAQHVLYLSATPIPRSLALARYGDMEVSQLRGMPEGSAEIATTLIPVVKAGKIVDRLKSRDTTDAKVFWVLPQINKSESSTRQHMTSANERYEALVEQLGEDRVSLLHGKMTSLEKNKTLSDFSASESAKGLRVLVSTSIIEVGVDVPRAGVCVVENAEMFGLSQLHQIRGRLGRTDRGKKAQAPNTPVSFGETGKENASSSKQTSHCILLYGPDISDDAIERLKAVRSTRDGFLLAERDLALRGPGEMLGVQQKGYFDGKFKLADTTLQEALADHANARARRLVDSWWSRGEGEASRAHGSGGENGDDAAPTTPSLAAMSTTGETPERRGGHEDCHEAAESDRAEGFGLLLALCGHEDDAWEILEEFASSPRRGGPGARAVASSSAACLPGDGDGEGTAAAAAAASGRGSAGTNLSLEKADDDELDGLLKFSSFLLPETGKVSPSANAPPAMPPPKSYSLLDHETTPPAAEATDEAAGASALTAPSDNDERWPTVPASGETAAGVETLFEDEADFLARSASEHAEMADGQWGDEEGSSSFWTGFSPISAAPFPPSRGAGTGVAEASSTDDSGAGFPSQRASDRNGDNRPQESPRGADEVRMWVGKPLARGHVGGGPLDGGNGEEKPVEAGAPSSIIRRADLSGGSHTVVLFDLETTGLSTKHDRVIQLAGKVMGSGDPKHSFSALVDPEGAYMSREVRALTGITPEILAENDARSFREVWPLFAQWLSDVQAAGVEEVSGEDDEDGGGGIVLVAHNANFDNRFLVEEQARGGFDRFMMGGEMGIVSVVDSLTILRQNRMWRQNGTDWDVPWKPEKFNLSVLFKHLYGVDMPGAHTALGDVHGLESVLSAPGISERWRLVASTTPSCQIPVPRSLAELQAATRASPSPRAKKPSTKGRRYSSKASSRRNYSTRRGRSVGP